MTKSVKPRKLYNVAQVEAAIAKAVAKCYTRGEVANLVAAATAARGTLDSLRNGASFSKAMYEAGYIKLRDSLVPFNVEQTLS